MHFLTIVVGEDPDAQLEPYQENNTGDCPLAYLEFWDVEAEFREYYRVGLCDGPGGKPAYPDRCGPPLREVFPTFDHYMAEVYGPRDARTGRYGDWFNPHAEYDWYEFGGRFSGHLILKPGRQRLTGNRNRRAAPPGPGRADQARKGDVDFGAMSRASYEKFLAAWAELEQTGKTADRWAKFYNLIPETVTTQDQLIGYARRRSPYAAPEAVVFGGEWFGPWWLKDDLTEAEAEKWDLWYSALLATLPEDAVLTVIDCHVV